MSEAARLSKFCYPPTRLHSVTIQNTAAWTFNTIKQKKSFKTDLKMESLLSPKILVTIYHLTWHNVPKDLNHHQHSCENLTSLKVSYLITDILVQYWQNNSIHNKNHNNIMVESVSTRWLQKKIILINIQL